MIDGADPSNRRQRLLHMHNQLADNRQNQSSDNRNLLCGRRDECQISKSQDHSEKVLGTASGNILCNFQLSKSDTGKIDSTRQPTLRRRDLGGERSAACDEDVLSEEEGDVFVDEGSNGGKKSSQRKKLNKKGPRGERHHKVIPKRCAAGDPDHITTKSALGTLPPNLAGSNFTVTPEPSRWVHEPAESLWAHRSSRNHRRVEAYWGEHRLPLRRTPAERQPKELEGKLASTNIHGRGSSLRRLQVTYTDAMRILLKSVPVQKAFEGSLYMQLGSHPSTPCVRDTDSSLIRAEMVLTHDSKKNIPRSQDDLLPRCPVVDAHVALVRTPPAYQCNRLDGGSEREQSGGSASSRGSSSQICASN
ncbi:hypothetical protein EYF80_030208 [Liparis tanakae]|uniref:Uncharacterized protein n=1 Tax=Liparis tanakae TaxID=230148 RepID=A0A4Z2H134_9TELE|nr:hypothetical protein EYF80_030208 [Liparis tanakae]